MPLYDLYQRINGKTVRIGSLRLVKKDNRRIVIIFLENSFLVTKASNNVLMIKCRARRRGEKSKVDETEERPLKKSKKSSKKSKTTEPSEDIDITY